jgi:tryptophan-rich sensory protein
MDFTVGDFVFYILVFVDHSLNDESFDIFSTAPALVWMVFTAFTLDGGAAAMLIPSLLAAIISGGINFVVFWNRLGTRSQKKALAAIGWA